MGYSGELYILAFDHRSSFTKRFGVEGDPTAEDNQRFADGKHLIFEGIEALVDEQFGGPTEVPQQAKARGIKLAMPVEKSGQKEFDFEYGEDFGAHIERYLFELLVPAEEDQLAPVDGDAKRYDAELRPDLMVRAIRELQDAGIESDVWKIEGVDERADDDKVDDWLRAGAPVDGYVGFAIGRSIWGDPLKGWIEGALSREDAASQIAHNYLRFIEVYTVARAESA